MSDAYCPEPDPADYVRSGINYPVPEDKRLSDSTNISRDEIMFEPKVEKSATPKTDLSRKNLEATTQTKEKNSLHPQLEAMRKAEVALKSSIDRVRKGRQSVFANANVSSRKAVNEI